MYIYIIVKGNLFEFLYLIFIAYIYISNKCIYISSSSSCRAASMDIPDPLSPLLPIIHSLWQVFRATSHILT